MKRIGTRPEWRQRVVVVADVKERDAFAVMRADELEEHASLKLEKRRAEWLSSRVAAKLAAFDAGLVPELSRASVDRQTIRPLLVVDGKLSHLHLSLSHSADAAAAAVGENRVGIDLQEVRQLDARAAKFFLNDDERPIAERSPLPDALIHFWCAKEAAWKASAPEGSTMMAVSFDGLETGGHGFTAHYHVEGREGTVETERMTERFVIAFAHE